MVVDRYEGLEIARVTTAEEAARHERAFVDAYRRIFAGEPYFEDFTEAEAQRVWRRLTSCRGHITLVAYDPARGADELVGFAVAIPLVESVDVARLLTGLLPVRTTMYLVELGVDEEWRGRGLGRHLVKLRVHLTDAERYSHVVLRVAEGRTATFELYRGMGFSDVGVSMAVSQRRTDGQVKSDNRYFMSRVLSQVELDG
jgi:ribosomal protein S18 acetylase RimI-like enzyme